VQVPYPSSAVVAGLVKLNMLRLSQDVQSGGWRALLRLDWASAACLPPEGLVDTRPVRSAELSVTTVWSRLRAASIQCLNMYGLSRKVRAMQRSGEAVSSDSLSASNQLSHVVS
jgi:hypothetical protein